MINCKIVLIKKVEDKDSKGRKYLKYLMKAIGNRRDDPNSKTTPAKYTYSFLRRRKPFLDT